MSSQESYLKLQSYSHTFSTLLIPFFSMYLSCVIISLLLGSKCHESRDFCLLSSLLYPQGPELTWYMVALALPSTSTCFTLSVWLQVRCLNMCILSPSSLIPHDLYIIVTPGRKKKCIYSKQILSIYHLSDIVLET